MGSTGAITRALGALMDRRGVTLRLGSTVNRVGAEDGAATAVKLAVGGVIAADLVVSNADAAHLYATMVSRAEQAWSARMKLSAAVPI
jgi:phytoene desaturase